MEKRIGELLVEKKILKEDEVQRILAHSLTFGLSFGDACADLGIVSREKLTRSIGPSFSGDWFDLKPNLLPEATKSIFKLEDMIRLGVIGLGFKKGYGFLKHERLNVGMLDPENKQNVSEMKKRLSKGHQDPKIYLVPVDRFLESLEKNFDLDTSTLGRLSPDQVNPVLSLFLNSY